MAVNLSNLNISLDKFNAVSGGVQREGRQDGGCHDFCPPSSSRFRTTEKCLPSSGSTTATAFP